ncbi:MAG: HAD family hydrolase [Opitutales bacterium]
MRWGALFDWDGVIIDSSRQHELSWEQLAREESLKLPPDHFHQGFGRKNTWIIPNILGWASEPAEIARLGERKEWLYREILKAEGIQPLPGVKALLEGLREAGVPRAVGSSTPRVNIETILDLLGLDGIFDAIVAAEDVSQGKPDPEVFLKGAAAIQREPTCCIVFEDMPVGLQAAKAGGMKAVAVTTSKPRDALTAADRIVDSFEALTLDELEGLVASTA